VRFRVSDVHTGAPVAGLFPAAWLDRRLGGVAQTAETDKESCRKRVQGFVGGSYFNRPVLDLNVYYVLALNEDATITVVDPLFGFGNSKLLDMVFLESPGEDWALSDDGRRVFVSLPGSDRVAVVETEGWKVVAGLATGPRPRRLALQPDGQYLWAAYEGAAGSSEPSGVTVIDARRLEVVARIPTGRGSHDLVLSPDSRHAFVTNEADGTVSVIEVARLAKVRDVAVGSRPTSIAWSSAAGAAYSAQAGDGSLVAVRADAAAPAARLALSPGLGRVRFAPGGRLAFVVHPDKKQVLIVDAATNRLLQTAEVEAEPDLVTFSDELAYVRHRGSETVLMIPLKVVGQEGQPVALVDFPGGQNPPGRTPLPSLADGIVQAPGSAAVLVANPLDKAIYFYKEGMAAPMGHFRNYGHVPRAVLVVDRSLTETAPGSYETTIRLGAPGEYDVALLLDAPRLTHCFPLTIAADPALAAERARREPQTLAVEVLAGSPTDGGGAAPPSPPVVTVGSEVPIRVRLTDRARGTPRTGLRDVRVLTFLSPGTWQQRHWADEVGDGVYEIRFKPPEPGLYFVFLEVASAGITFQGSPLQVLQVEGQPAAAPPAPTPTSLEHLTKPEGRAESSGLGAPASCRLTSFDLACSRLEAGAPSRRHLPGDPQ
jgi:YVTN family beta-propeller protein